MAWIDPRAVAHRRKMFTRHDAWRWAPPGSPESKMPGWRDPSATRVRLKEAQEEEARAAFDAKVKALRASHEQAREILAEIKYEFAWRKLCRKYGYDPDQPRDEVGRWTDNGQGDQTEALSDTESMIDVSTDSRAVVISDATPDGVRAWAQYAEVADNKARDDAAVARTTVTLHSTLMQVSGAIARSPDVSPQEYGTEVHTVFAKTLRALNLPGIGTQGVEQSFDKEGEARYGKDGSIRTDVVLRNDERSIIAIYDLKTGNATIRPSRATELRAMTGADSDVPVIELHSVRGPRRR